jgi:hypothetical protein
MGNEPHNRNPASRAQPTEKLYSVQGESEIGRCGWPQLSIPWALDLWIRLLARDRKSKSPSCRLSAVEISPAEGAARTGTRGSSAPGGQQIPPVALRSRVGMTKT